MQNTYIEKADTVKYDDVNNTYIANLRENNLGNSYDDLFKFYTSNKYTCKKEKYEKQ